MIQNLEHDIKFLGNKRRFLEEVMTGDIKLFDDKGKTRKSRKTLDIFKDLEKRGYDKEVKESKKEDDEDENEEKSNGYDYLLRLQFRSITEEKINKLKNDIDSKIKIRDTLSNTTEKELWIQDLDEFEKAYVKWVKDVEKEVVKSNKK
jgi:DNA topoisomerase-2